MVVQVLAVLLVRADQVVVHQISLELLAVQVRLVKAIMVVRKAVHMALQMLELEEVEQMLLLLIR